MFRSLRSRDAQIRQVDPSIFCGFWFVFQRFVLLKICCHSGVQDDSSVGKLQNHQDIFLVGKINLLVAFGSCFSTICSTENLLPLGVLNSRVATDFQQDKSLKNRHQKPQKGCFFSLKIYPDGLETCRVNYRFSTFV